MMICDWCTSFFWWRIIKVEVVIFISFWILAITPGVVCLVVVKKVIASTYRTRWRCVREVDPVALVRCIPGIGGHRIWTGATCYCPLPDVSFRNLWRNCTNWVVNLGKLSCWFNIHEVTCQACTGSFGILIRHWSVDKSKTSHCLITD
jgi:hypothetical protein